MGSLRRFAMLAAATGALAAAMPASAQFSDGYTFLKAVKDRDGDKALPLLDRPGAPVLSSRDPDTGDTALHIVTRRHDQTWMAFLLSRGAQTELKDRAGDTPLSVAARTDDTAAVQLLLAAGANPNSINGNGETPLILAVHNRDTAVVRQLVSAGGDPQIRDTIAGKSAADYAGEDRRSAAIAKLLDEAKPRKPAANIAGPTR